MTVYKTKDFIIWYSTCEFFYAFHMWISYLFVHCCCLVLFLWMSFYAAPYSYKFFTFYNIRYVWLNVSGWLLCLLYFRTLTTGIHFCVLTNILLCNGRMLYTITVFFICSLCNMQLHYGSFFGLAHPIVHLSVICSLFLCGLLTWMKTKSCRKTKCCLSVVLCSNWWIQFQFTWSKMEHAGY